MIIKFNDIKVGTRYRKEYGDVSGLGESLTRVGSIHPIVLSRDSDGTYTLVAGGRRHAAMKNLGVTELHHSSVLNPAKLGFLFKEDVPEDELREAELDENLYRLKPKWQEDIEMIADIHDLKRKKEGTNKWGLRQTAELLGPGYGRTNVNYAIRLAKLIKVGDKDIMAASNMSEAISILVKRKEDEALAELNRRATPTAGIAGTGQINVSSFLETMTKPMLVIPKSLSGEVLRPPTSLEEHNERMTLEVLSASPSTPNDTPQPPVSVPLSRMFFLGDFRELTPQFPDACFDHIVTDIPYGIDMDNLEGVEDVAAEHDVDSNIELMQPFLREAFRLTKSGGFCVFFYDLDHHEKLQSWATEIGWRVQRWPFIACKTSTCRNQAAQYNRTKNYEVAMYLRRDEKTVLRKACPTSWETYDFYAERKLYNNPFAKPFKLWKDIYESIAFPGQSVADFFCGEMSACRAAVNCGLVPYGFEKKEQHFNRGLEHMKSVFALVHKSNVNFT